jgi:hypothetical protein
MIDGTVCYDGRLMEEGDRTAEQRLIEARSLVPIECVGRVGYEPYPHFGRFLVKR